MNDENRPLIACRSKPSDGQLFWLTAFEALVNFDLGGAQIRRETALPGADADQRVGLVGTHAENAARPMIFERAAHQMDAIGEQAPRQAYRRQIR